MQKVIINADDLGISESVNLEIKKFIELKVISSATILANGSAVDSIGEIVDNNPQISFGVHLNLDEFEPLMNSPVLTKAGFINENGFVKGHIHKADLSSKEIINSIYEELYAQVQKIANMGIHISHLDSHHHFHVRKELSGILIELSKQFNIIKIRRPILYTPYYLSALRTNNSTNPASLINHNSPKNRNMIDKVIYYSQDYYRKMRWISSMKTTFKMTEGFYSYKPFTIYAKKRGNMKILEIMCHPGHPKYKEESDLIERNVLKEIFDYELISYAEL